MNATHFGHQHDDDERDLRQQLGPLRDLHRQHTEAAVVNMSVRVHEALQHSRRRTVMARTLVVSAGLATVIAVVVVLNLHRSDSETHGEIVSTGSHTITDTVKNNREVFSTPNVHVKTTPSGEKVNQVDADQQRRESSLNGDKSQSLRASSTHGAIAKVRSRGVIEAPIVILPDSEMLLAVNDVNEDVIVDRILDLEPDDDLAILDLTSADVDAVLP